MSNPINVALYFVQDIKVILSQFQSNHKMTSSCRIHLPQIQIDVLKDQKKNRTDRQILTKTTTFTSKQDKKSLSSSISTKKMICA